VILNIGWNVKTFREHLRLVSAKSNFSRTFPSSPKSAGLGVSPAPLLDPIGRRGRRVSETPRLRMWKDLALLVLVTASLPFTLLEAACWAGSTVMIEARKK
jgi:hypothetical protein